MLAIVHRSERPTWRVCLHLLVHHTLDSIKTHLQHIHLGTVRESHKVVARAVEQVTATRWVEVKEDTRDNNNLLLQAGLEEVKTISDRARKTLEVEPAIHPLSVAFKDWKQAWADFVSQVEGRVGHIFDDEAHLAQSTDDHITLVLDGDQRLVEYKLRT
jgi:hypothetical protein